MIHELYDNNIISWSLLQNINEKLQDCKTPLEYDDNGEW